MSAPKYTNPEEWHGIEPADFEIKIKGLSRNYTFFHLTDLHLCELSPNEADEMSEARRTYIRERKNFFTHAWESASALWKDYMARAKEESAALLLLTGDILDFPSNANIQFLKDGIQNSGIPTLYVVGNHDWSFADDYHTENAASLHLPKFNSLCNDSPHICGVEYEDLIVCAIDDTLDRVSKETVDTFMTLCSMGKPVILIMHVPLYIESMESDCLAVWRNLLMVGDKAYNGDDPQVKRFYEFVALYPDTPVKAVITGHLHFYHEDILPNGVPQIVTDKGYTGGCRVIKVVGE